MKVRIVWNGTGGELDSTMIEAGDDDSSIKDALIDLMKDGIVSVGDSFTVQEVA